MVTDLQSFEPAKIKKRIRVEIYSEIEAKCVSFTQSSGSGLSRRAAVTLYVVANVG